MRSTEAIVEGLTDAQIESVTHVDGPLLVLAGPGSGKTTVVTKRIANLVANGVAPWNILALTFTNKAATEMRERVFAQIDPETYGIKGLTVSTFHSFCARTLRSWGDKIIGTRSFTIYDTSDQKSAVKTAIRACELNETNWKPASVLSIISGAKNQLLDAESFAAEANDFHSKTIAKIYRSYESILRSNDAVDFDDLLLCTAQLLSRDAEVRNELQQRYQYLLIDEYQDTNRTQFVIADHIASKHRNICVVGDPDQSIYAWRGADISNILDFETQYENATVVPLGRNFRSTGHIVETAAKLIAYNKLRKEKRLYTELEKGNKPIMVTLPNEHEEADAILREVKRLHKDGTPYKEMAVLYRVNALSRVLEDAFRNEGVPYIVARGTAFYDRREVKDAVSYLRLLVNPKDDVAFRRIINAPARGIGKTSLVRLEQLASSRGLNMLAATEFATKDLGFTARSAKGLHAFHEMLTRWRIDADSTQSLTAAASLADLVERMVRESGLEASFKRIGTEEDHERLENLEELVSAASDFEEKSEDEGASPLQLLFAFLEHVALVSDSDAIDPRIGAVTLMTLHAAKGLEYDFIALAGLEDGLLPHIRALFDDTQMEEERRLCFVGITRARKHLHISSTLKRTQRGMTERAMPSRFLREMSGSHTHQETVVDTWNTQIAPEFTPSKNGNEITLGTVVRHKRFGVGKVQRVLRRERGSTVTVDFPSGTKHLVLEYANLEIVPTSC
ncbi:MAG: UvrD-helicase domain-containing protein [Planctomycetes bacterium]|nr:UvrD-helicase domain-containing protein [Planctomycetota bacterium]